MSEHIKQLYDIKSKYEHIYISPHLDDAVLSCGGSIANYTNNKKNVLILNICTGIPQYNTNSSNYVQKIHKKWGHSADHAMKVRIQEDISAMKYIGADNYNMGFLDAIYRNPNIYNSKNSLFGTIDPYDSIHAILEENIYNIANICPMATFYAPLGIGMHVDHQLSYIVANILNNRGINVVFYEDFPYVCEIGAIEQRMMYIKGYIDLTFEVLTIDETMTSKILAIESYYSQLSTLFRNGTVSQFVTEYASSLQPRFGKYGERFWKRKSNS